MNTKNNRRRRESVEKIEQAFMELLQEHDLTAITVTDICKRTGLNRSTFYANFEDIYALADHLREKLEGDFAALFRPEQIQDAAEASLTMFRHMADHQLFYRTYFKLGYDEQHSLHMYDQERARRDFDGQHVPYHIAFFQAGFNAMVKLWLANGCKENPEEMNAILMAEYKGRE